MQYYSAKIRLAGSVSNEVRRDEISAPELMLLKRIHGPDAVLDVEYGKKGNVDHSEERKRLFEKYPTAINAEAKRHYVEELFGPAHTDLPAEDPQFKSLAGVEGLKRSRKPTAETIVE